MKNKGELAQPEARRWTRADEYVSALVRRRTTRLKREVTQGRTQPETPRLLLSTVPFLALIAALAILGVAIMITAWPGSRPQATHPPQQHEQGVAQKGWFQEAEKEFREGSRPSG
jgi:anti-sigma factor RsiW